MGRLKYYMRRGIEGEGKLYRIVFHIFGSVVNCVFSFSFPKLIVPQWGNKKKKVCAVGYIGIDDSGGGDDIDDASAGPRTSHSQLVPFTAPSSVLVVTLLPLFSNSSRSEANKRCVRSALGCKCSISVNSGRRPNSHKYNTERRRCFFFLF
jgi:hypothetical protein